jgi:hypothetical protein
MKPMVITAQSLEGLKAQIHDKRIPGAAYTLAIVFASASHDLLKLQPFLADLGLDVFAGSSAAEIAGDAVLEESITLMLLNIDRSAYRIKVFELADGGPSQMGRAVASWANGAFEKPALMIMVSGQKLDGDLLIHSITEHAGDRIPLFGGFASYDLAALPRDTVPLVCDSRRAVAEGIVALAFDTRRIELKGIAASGWKGVGTAKTITKADGNVVHEIDGRPAHDVINRYLEIGDDVEVALEYPLCWTREDGSEVLRGIIGFNEDKSLVYAGTVPQGAKVRFSFPPGTEVIEEAVSQMSSFKNSGSAGDAVILFSCRARYTALGPMVEDEVEAINALWGGAQIGFFTFGEIGPGPQGRCDFHNYTIVAVQISQKEPQSGDGA